MGMPEQKPQTGMNIAPDGTIYEILEDGTIKKIGKVSSNGEFEPFGESQDGIGVKNGVIYRVINGKKQKLGRVLPNGEIEQEKKKRGCLGCFGKLIIILLAIAVLGFAGFVGVVAIANGISVKVVLFQLYGEFFPAPYAVYIKGHVHGQDWSYPSDYEMTWKEAVKYCDNLTEDGHSDWRLPTISELRHLIKECPKTMSGGTCRVSDKCLEGRCYNGECGGCSWNSSGAYSEFGEIGWFWSSSTRSDLTDTAWAVGFKDGDVYNYGKSYNCYVRCVR